jgi:hypothetical protein
MSDKPRVVLIEDQPIPDRSNRLAVIGADLLPRTGRQKRPRRRRCGAPSTPTVADRSQEEPGAWPVAALASP